MLNPSFSARAAILLNITAQSNPTVVLQCVADNTLFIWDLLKIQTVGITVPNLALTTVAVERLRVESVVVTDHASVQVDLRIVLPFLAKLFEIDTTVLNGINPYSPDCLEVLRQLLLNLLAREEQVQLYARTFDLVAKRAGNLSQGQFGNGVVQLGLSASSTVDCLRRLLGSWNIRTIATEAHGDGPVLIF